MTAGVLMLLLFQSATPRPSPITPPKLLKIQKPDCGKGAACYGIHGDITVVADVLEDGTVGKTEATGSDPVLVEAAVAAAKTAVFEPGKFLNKPKSMNFDLKFHF
ncbi:energy transducer TonB [Terriglobus sp. TAA 43]|uniref:energy transducer TonB n=1 Tax=Terriglobus sp. TAA 43 TaxID=278961 RepID=UPI0006459B56|nr:energy transducer TonB [Terriglobus sp. TAA 43]